MQVPSGDDWVALSADPLPVGDAAGWVVVPRCGGVVVFAGTVRDHAEGRTGVEALVYEAYEAQALRRMAAVLEACRVRWPDLGRAVCWHRTGRLELSEVAVVVAVSAPHRGEAFDAARFVIDTVKAGVPIWKHETWADGAAWGTGATPIAEVRA